MGRKKIEIKTIDDVRVRKVTFNKRKSGLIKKAMELSILCDCEIGLMIATPPPESKVFQYSSTTMPQVIQRLQQHEGPVIESRNNDDYGTLYSRKGDKGSDDEGGDDDGGDDAAGGDGGEKKRGTLSIQIPSGGGGLGAGMQVEGMQGLPGFGDGQVPTPGGMEAFPSPNQFLGAMTPNTMKEMQSFLASPNQSGPVSLGNPSQVFEDNDSNAQPVKQEAAASPPAKKQKKA